MIKIFRKIRRNLLSQNRIGKYLLYAIGEIVLVIIGILIALNLNKQNEQKKTEAKIDAIFENILIELESDINRSTRGIYIYRKKDSLASLVLNTDLTYDDYADNNSSGLWNLVMTRINYKTSSTGYNVLMSNVNDVPEKYNEAVRQLNSLHNDIKPQLQEYNALLGRILDRNYTDYQENYEWYTELYSRQNKEAIDYMLNDYKYKNKVLRYKRTVRTHKIIIENYRHLASNSYKEIATLLNKKLDSIDFIMTDKIIEKYVGTYTNNTESDQSIEIYFYNEDPPQLTLKGFNDKGFNDRHSLILPLKFEKEFSLGGIGILNFHKNEQGQQMTIYHGHTSTQYTKVKYLDK